MKIPEANPIRFNVLPPDKDGEHWYFQKFQRSDITTIQILVDNSEPAQDWTLQIFNSDDILQVYFTILKVEFTTLVEGIKIIEFYIYFSQAEEGLHYFVLSGGTSKFYSDFLCIKDKHEETKLITYHNSVNDQSVIFSTGIIFNVRVEAQDRHTPKSLVPKSVDSIYDNDMGGYMTLYSNPFETYRINIGSNAGIPDYLMKTVNRAFGCDILLLDNNKVNKVEGATFETVEAENYPLRSWLIEVGYYNDDITYTAASYGNPICQKVIELFVSASYGNPVCQKIDQTITYTSAEWTEPVCQKYDNSVSYTEAEWTNPICQQVSDVILLSIHLIKTGGFTTPNMFTIRWKYSEDVPQLFQTNIRLNSDVRVQNGSFAQLVNINIDFTATGTMGSATQTVNYDTLLGFVEGGTTLIKINPDTVLGKQIEVAITLN